MTNEQIIFENRVFLMEEGVIRETDETCMYEDENGRRRINVPEEIHTFDAWKQRGLIVKKGEHSVARFPIWKKANKKPKNDENGDETEVKQVGKSFYYKKVAFFFTRDQVEPIKK